MKMRRYRILPAHGTLLISTDLHGNGDDYRALKDLFLTLERERGNVHWVLLGDLVHAPDESARQAEPTLYGFPDESWLIAREMAELRAKWPDRVHLVLGNHDYGHIGGPRPAKFYADEVAYLESTLDEEKCATLRQLFNESLLAVLAPCGVLLAHGSPGETLAELSQLDDISLDPRENNAETNGLVRSFLTSYGQPPQVTARFLERVSKDAGFELRVVIHGHDRDIEGWFAEGLNQLCPVLFGAPRETKRYVQIDLAESYETVADVRDGVELLRLYR